MALSYIISYIYMKLLKHPPRRHHWFIMNLHLKFSLTVPGASKGSTVMNSDPISTIRPSLKPSVGWGTHTFLPPSMTATQLSFKVCWGLPPFLDNWVDQKVFSLFFHPEMRKLSKIRQEWFTTILFTAELSTVVV